MKIVFVRTGNANRSAAAEVILYKMIEDNDIPGIEVTSCETKVPEGLSREEIMCRIAAEHGYRMGGMAVPATEKILNDADLVIVLTQLHRDQITRILKYDNRHRIVLFNDYCFGEKTDLPDPLFQTEHVYRTCFDTF